MRVAQVSAYIQRRGDGTISRASAAPGCGYVELAQGKTYVLFLRHLEGDPRGDDIWGAGMGEPIAFEVYGEDVLATGDVYVTPADFGWSTLEDVRRDAEAVKGGGR